MPVGALLDRYGHDTGRYLAKEGTPYEKRALPKNTDKSNYHVYKILKPLPVLSGKATAWFGEPGGGIQYKTEYSIKWLIDNNYIEEILID